jgi:DNA-binding PadR family transcriptional regulator
MVSWSQNTNPSVDTELYICRVTLMARRRSSPQTRAVYSLFLESPADWVHGYDISSRLGIASGTLYPILMRLSDQGHLEAKWTESPTAGRPPRHIYRLTTAGKGWAVTALAERHQPDLRPVEGLA